MQPPIGVSVTYVSGEDRFSSIQFQNVMFVEKPRNVHGQSEYAHSTNPSNKMYNDKHSRGAQNKLHEQSEYVASSILSRTDNSNRSIISIPHVKVQVLTFQVLVIFSNVMVQFL